MIDESELPILTEDAEGAVSTQHDENKCNKVQKQINIIDKSVASQIITKISEEVMSIDEVPSQYLNEPLA